ncbi:hypothetical protein NDU88_008569 [Pleurodeles waltl]|uniref:Bulb-type lectin domain-containing protein n=1 Tax=Pleurodeles waltl TaxID=8319 RepID=A0AAV7N5C0_PLEWA|nr:hypothetical protein NDU88_008569 [Pleurodeles waltl]
MRARAWTEPVLPFICVPAPYLTLFLSCSGAGGTLGSAWSPDLSAPAIWTPTRDSGTVVRPVPYYPRPPSTRADSWGCTSAHRIGAWERSLWAIRTQRSGAAEDGPWLVAVEGDMSPEVLSLTRWGEAHSGAVPGVSVQWAYEWNGKILYPTPCRQHRGTLIGLPGGDHSRHCLLRRGILVLLSNYSGLSIWSASSTGLVFPLAGGP